MPPYCDPLKDVRTSALSAYEAVDVGLALKWPDLDFKDGNFVVARGFVEGIVGDPKSIVSRNRVEMHKAPGAVMLEWGEANDLRCR